MVWGSPRAACLVRVVIPNIGRSHNLYFQNNPVGALVVRFTALFCRNHDAQYLGSFECSDILLTHCATCARDVLCVQVSNLSAN